MNFPTLYFLLFRINLLTVFFYYKFKLIKNGFSQTFKIILHPLIKNIDCKKNYKTAKNKIPKLNNSYKKRNIKLADEIRPSDISRELFCDVCQAIIKEAIKNLRYLNKESDVIFYLTNGICLQNNFNDYHFSKPEMEIGCEVFISEYYEQIQKLLIKRNPKLEKDDNLIQKFCFEKIKACNGVNLSNIKPIKSEIINGELYDIENVEKTYKVYPKIEEVNYEDEILKREDNLKENNKSEL